jgi:hypothetical protein
MNCEAECKNRRPPVSLQVKATVRTEGGPVKALKTIVATAVIVFALTTVAMAGVQHLTKQSSQAIRVHAQTAQPTYTVTLTAAQLAQLMQGGQAATTGGVHHARQAHYHAKAARHHTASRHAGDATQASSSGSGGTHHHEPAHHASHSESGSGSHHAETSHHSGDCGDGGGDCGD